MKSFILTSNFPEKHMAIKNGIVYDLVTSEPLVVWDLVMGKTKSGLFTCRIYGRCPYKPMVVWDLVMGKRIK